ncbi:hypothetical protein SNOG_10179 [Parastagonospora nodorum SN15]|uniref:Uncharacterized protein n=1 Tax=Phaeosphaeria nodorum (strain SN15 / ATCC MYA-4574 / FGSC 10173) TaxID=321614 RepID=Q0UDI5_PHANO|nr:hypothetical protein SNOG_10179 [Parastagonospora nodorum SN15]EAT82514.1 hypothetical protein SNOG_10179 [Parastagonospora nodorum SN15]
MEARTCRYRITAGAFKLTRVFGTEERHRGMAAFG